MNASIDSHSSPGATGSVSGVPHLKPAVPEASLTWRALRSDEFWRVIPAWKDVDHATFIDHMWQERHAVTSAKKLLGAVQELVSPEFMADAEAGFRRAPMAVRVTPYVLALIDWSNPYGDPLRRQFIPVESQLEPDHPMLTLDSLGEQADAPVPGLTHRYPDKALFLVLDTCPVYCRFCTRSYAVGLDTEEVEKVQLKANRERWELAFQYISERPELEDIVISGGDSYRLKADQILEIGERLIAMPNIRRFRFATKGPAILPVKLLTDHEWVDALSTVVDKARRVGKDVVLHTHFNHPNEITELTRAAIGRLFERGIFVRNQAVFQRGVNDDIDTMRELNRRLAWINVHPYYVYMHDLVRGTEDLRTPVSRGVQVEKLLRGSSAGFNTPTFIVDAPGGGGKRDIHSFEHYDRTTGISVYSAPAVKHGKLFTYFDPMSSLSADIQARWHNPKDAAEMISAAVEEAKRIQI